MDVTIKRLPSSIPEIMEFLTELWVHKDINYLVKVANSITQTCHTMKGTYDNVFIMLIIIRNYFIKNVLLFTIKILMVRYCDQEIFIRWGTLNRIVFMCLIYADDLCVTANYYT